MIYPFRVFIGPIYPPHVARRLNRDTELRCEAGTEHVYGRIEADNETAAAFTVAHALLMTGLGCYVDDIRVS